MTNIFGIDLNSTANVELSLKETANVFNGFSESFVGEVEIMEAKVSTAKSGAMSLELKVKEVGGAEREESFLNIYYLSKDGAPIEMGISKMGALGHLLKKLEQFNAKADVIVGDKIGIILELTDDGRKYLNKDIKGFYSTKAGLTWSELKAGKTVAEAKVVSDWKKTFEKTPVKIGKNYEENKKASTETQEVESKEIEEVM